MPPIDRVLLVDDDSSVREALGQTLELADLRPTLAGSYIEAKDHLTRDFAGVVISDIRMPGKDGFALLHYAQSVDAELPVILLTGEGDVPMAVRGISEGAFDFLEKPCAPNDLVAVVEKALKTRALVLENRRLKRQVEQGDAAARLLRGVSALSKRMREEARAVARSAADVLVTGEPGVGTAKMAEVVHLLSAGSMAPFLKYPASAMTEDSLAQAFATAKGGFGFSRRDRGPVQSGAIRAFGGTGAARPAPPYRGHLCRSEQGSGRGAVFARSVLQAGGCRDPYSAVA